MHKVADQVEAAVTIPLVHLADATAAAVRRAGLTTVGLLGTAFTMEQDFYRDRLAGHGLRVLVRRPTTAPKSTALSTTSSALATLRRSHGRCTATSSADSHMPVPRALSWAARRSSCWWARGQPVPVFRPPGCMSRRPSPFHWRLRSRDGGVLQLLASNFGLACH